MNCIKSTILIFCCFSSIGLFAQTPKAVETDLLKSFKKIDYWNEHQDGDLKWVENLEQANKEFGKKLKLYTEKYPFILTQDFALLKKEHLDISTSSDGLFRIYSWDTWTGGTTHFFESVMQYKIGKSTFSILDTPKTEDDIRPNYHKMFTFKINGRTYYLSTYLEIGSTKDVSDGVHVFTIQNGKLIDAKIIKTQSGIHSDLSYDYDFGSVVSTDFEKRPSISFDNVTNTIDLPLVDGNRNITNKHILYKFTGQYFERVKN